MARFRKIDPRIWNDAKFASLSHLAQLMFFFVLTHPMMTVLGAFRISKEGMAAELGLVGEGFAKPFSELLSKGLLKYEERSFLIFAPNFLKYNEPENPNVIKGWAGAVDLLPECALMVSVLDRAKAAASKTEAGRRAFDLELERVRQTLAERYGQPLSKSLANQEQEQEQKQEIKTASPIPVDREAKKREPLIAFPDVLPDEWREDARKARPDIDPDYVFTKLKARYVGTATTKMMKTWRREYMNWIGREFAKTRPPVADAPYRPTERFDLGEDNFFKGDGHEDVQGM